MNRTLRLIPLILSSISLLHGQSMDISGYKIVQANAGATIAFPAGTLIEPGGYVVVGRNATKSAFETAWGTTLATNVVFLNGTTVAGGNGFPVINGSETYDLQNASGVSIDGVTVAEATSAQESLRRLSPIGAANLEASWSRGAMTAATPGTGMENTNTGKLIISEFSDASAFANEFIELYYDVSPSPKGQGTALLSPPKWKYSDATTIQIVLKPQTDTLRAIRFQRPTSIQWNALNISAQPAGTVTPLADTMIVTKFAVGANDSIIVTITGVTAVDTTDQFLFDIRTSTDGVMFLPIQTQPKTLVYGNPRPMNLVKRKEVNGAHTLLGKWVVVQGDVTVANEFNGPSYLQDATAGIAVYDSSVSNNVNRGDRVTLLGMVAPFNNLFELTPCTILEKITEGNPVDTTILTISQIVSQTASEPYESRLIRINGITSVTSGGVPATAWTVSGSGTNYDLTNSTGTVQTRISPRVNLANLPTPVGAFDMVGVLGQFASNYQILPRFIDDIVQEGAGPRIVSQTPYESNIMPTSLTFQWKTDVAGTSSVRIGKTNAYGTVVTDPNNVTDHQVVVTGLSSATIYHVQLASTNASGTTTSFDYVASTSSQSSTGAINVYFNKSVNTTLSIGENAQTVSLQAKLLDRINAASYSIDACLYSLSGTVGANIATGLVGAKSRGVKVRVIGEKDNASTAPWTTLKTNGIPVIDDGFDAINAAAGLMHNKFIVIDNRDTTSQSDDWIWTGSWNLTDPGTNDDMQDAIEIQDKALANAYTAEFNEMWGSDTETPNAAASRFGARKLNNTPHLFIINGIPVESYFSPSDHATNQIVKTINKAQYSIDFALLTLTRSDIANALVTKKKGGLKVRGVIDNKTDQGTQFDTLLTKGVDVRLDVNIAYLHHKYGIVDAETTSPLQYTMTGSHNWTASAENSNNENMLIIQSKRIANLYLQEFVARYKESGGADNITVNVERVGDIVPKEFCLSQNYPNPFNPRTEIRVQIAEASVVSLKIYDVLGREVATFFDESKAPGVYAVSWDASRISSGVYLYRLQTRPTDNSKGTGFVETRKMILTK